MKEKKTLLDKVSHVVTLAGTVILMNLMFLIASLPIVTIGPAWCGLLSSIRYNIRGDGWFSGFKAGFCTRFWRSLIIWCVCLPLCLFFLNDLNQALINNDIAYCIVSGIFFALAGMLTTALLTLNVYIPTSLSNWLKNSVNFFRHPLPLLAAAALFWAPLVLALLVDMLIFLQIIMIFVAAYFALAAVCATMLLKDPLIDFLLDARADGTLTAEEGSAPQTEEAEE